MPVVLGESPGSRLRSSTAARNPRAAAAEAQERPAKLPPTTMRSNRSGMRAALYPMYFAAQSMRSPPRAGSECAGLLPRRALSARQIHVRIDPGGRARVLAVLGLELAEELRH